MHPRRSSRHRRRRSHDLHLHGHGVRRRVRVRSVQPGIRHDPRRGPENLLSNGTFEGHGSGSLTGWKGQDASLALVSRRRWRLRDSQHVDGGPRHLTASRPSPTPSTYGQCRRRLHRRGRVNALNGKSVCLKVTEGARPAQTVTVLRERQRRTGRTLPGIDYTALAEGDTLNYHGHPEDAGGRAPFPIDTGTIDSRACRGDLSHRPTSTPTRSRRPRSTSRGIRPERAASLGTTSTETAAARPSPRSTHRTRATRTRPSPPARRTCTRSPRSTRRPNRPVKPGDRDHARGRRLREPRRRRRHRLPSQRPRLQRRSRPERQLPAGRHGRPDRPGLVRQGARAWRPPVRLRIAGPSTPASTRAGVSTMPRWSLSRKPRGAGDSEDNETGARESDGLLHVLHRPRRPGGDRCEREGLLQLRPRQLASHRDQRQLRHVGRVRAGDPEEAGSSRPRRSPAQCTLAYWHQAAWSTTGDDQASPTCARSGPTSRMRASSSS